MIYYPPFTITTEIIDLISAVSEQVFFVQGRYHFSSANAPRNALVNSQPMLPTDQIYCFEHSDLDEIQFVDISDMLRKVVSNNQLFPFWKQLNA
ncbi:MAG: hypothetical protein JKY87_02515 [Mariprofundus sp.]|nr:hypothetical protein [Mariprofundus sp.]